MLNAQSLITLRKREGEGVCDFVMSKSGGRAIVISFL